MLSFRALALATLPALSALILTAPARADVKDGVDAWASGDYQKAVAEWRPLAVAGDPDAQFNLGQAYKLGRGVPVDLAQAEAWYRRAAKQGHLQAEDNLGLVLFTANKRAEAMPYIAASAERGEPRAQYVLGTAMFNGDLAAKDWPRAYALTKRASDAGLDIASARLAQLDQLIPLEQRRIGLALIPQIEKDEARARLAAVNAAAPEPAVPAPSPVKTAALPPSVPGTTYTPPPVIQPPAAQPPVTPPAPVAAAPAAVAAPASAVATAAQKPVQPASPAATAAASAAVEATNAAKAAAAATPATPGTTYAPPPVAAGAPVKAATAEPKPVPAKPATVTATTGPWRAQFGAFGVEANAKSLWTALQKKYPAVAARQPTLVKSATLTRLQTGDFATKAETDAFCAPLREAGQACLAVDK